MGAVASKYSGTQGKKKFIAFGKMDSVTCPASPSGSKAALGASLNRTLHSDKRSHSHLRVLVIL